MNSSKRLFTAAILTALISGCTGAPVYVETPLPVPPRPVLPAISEEEVQCLPQPVYAKLVLREMLFRGYIKELEAIQRAHNGAKKP
jgi:hypothetical protein